MKSITIRFHPPTVFTAAVLFILLFSGRPSDITNVNQISSHEHAVMSVLWFQTAAEARALQYQAYNIARLRLNADLADKKPSKKRAVVVDIDETIVNNITYEGQMIRINKEYPYEWGKWIDMAEAKALPGSVEFLSYAVSKGVDVFYVTGRTMREKPATLQNLRKCGFPQVSDDHVFVRADESSKEKRRLKISENHRTVLLMGDNLADLSAVFDRKSVAERNAEVDNLKDEFGNRFIVLPNPVYGDWETALYGYQSGLSDSAKNVIRKEALKGY
jgi:5'-nucleotidase (lipoprotein e(P4) family)